MRARLNIFSGLPDPEWTLPPESARALQERFHALLQQSVAQDTQVPDHLGYRGIEILPDPGDTIGQAHVYRGTVIFVDARREACDPALERWLIDHAPSLDPSLRDHIAAELS